MKQPRLTDHKISPVILEDDSTCNLNTFSDIQILKRISNSKFPIFLAFSPFHQKNYAIKIFSCSKGEVSPSFKKEARFMTLNHPNIVSIVGTQELRVCADKDRPLYASSLVMELGLFDFIDLLPLAEFHLDEILARTYFSQLIEGLDYLHSQGISHLDIKAENLLLSEDYQLKIIDFDLSYKEGEPLPTGKGTIQFRAPELITGKIKNPKQADIYSAGIMLFILRLGHLPYDENGPIKGYDLQGLLYRDPKGFWDAHEAIRSPDITLDDDFKNLFISMTRYDPAARISIQEIKNHSWFRQNKYSESELSNIMKEKLSKSH